MVFGTHVNGDIDIANTTRSNVGGCGGVVLLVKVCGGVKKNYFSLGEGRKEGRKIK